MGGGYSGFLRLFTQQPPAWNVELVGKLTDGTPRNVSVRGNYAYAADEGSGLWILRYTGSYIKSISETIAHSVCSVEPYQGNSVEFPSIAVDANGSLHVIYQEKDWVSVKGKRTLSATSIKHVNKVFSKAQN